MTTYSYQNIRAKNNVNILTDLLDKNMQYNEKLKTAKNTNIIEPIAW